VVEIWVGLCGGLQVGGRVHISLGWVGERRVALEVFGGEEELVRGRLEDIGVGTCSDSPSVAA
jgi:hypothetical protein